MDKLNLTEFLTLKREFVRYYFDECNLEAWLVGVDDSEFEKELTEYLAAKDKFSQFLHRSRATETHGNDLK